MPGQKSIYEIFGCTTLCPEFVVLNDFYAKTGASEGAEQLLGQLAAFTPGDRQFLPTPSFVHRLNYKAPLFRDRTL